MNKKNELNYIRKQILELYPEYNKVYGPYTSNDKRTRISLYNNETLCKTTKQYARVKYEVFTGKRICENLTIDHIDKNKNNDDISNLRIISREENSRRSAIGNKYAKGFKQTDNQKRSGDKNGMSKLNKEDVFYYRNNYIEKNITKKEIIEKTGLSRKSVDNLLNGKTYTYLLGSRNIDL